MVLRSERFPIVEMHAPCTRQSQVQRTCISIGPSALGDFRTTRAYGIECYGNFISRKKFSTLPGIRTLDVRAGISPLGYRGPQIMAYYNSIPKVEKYLHIATASSGRIPFFEGKVPFWLFAAKKSTWQHFASKTGNKISLCQKKSY